MKLLKLLPRFVADALPPRQMMTLVRMALFPAAAQRQTNDPSSPPRRAQGKGGAQRTAVDARHEVGVRLEAHERVLVRHEVDQLDLLDDADVGLRARELGRQRRRHQHRLLE